jgi:hypothetical protein
MDPGEKMMIWDQAMDILVVSGHSHLSDAFEQNKT